MSLLSLLLNASNENKIRCGYWERGLIGVKIN
jgi:hypothetical protein